MSNEFKQNDRVSINKDLTFTAPRFGVAKDMHEIFTGTVTRYPFQGENEVTVMLDYPDDVPECNRISYSYDPRDLTLILNEEEIPKNEEEVPQKGNTTTEPKKNDRVEIDKSLKYTKKRFGLTDEMKTIFTGTINRIGENNKAIVSPDGSEWSYTYDLRDLTLITRNGFPTPTNVKTSDAKTTVEFSDGSTTSVKKSAGDPYDLETAIAYCIAKKIVTNSCIKRLAKNAEDIGKVDTEFYNKFLKPYGFLNGKAYFDVEIDTLKDYLKTLNDVRSEMALIAIENDLTKDELFNKLRG